MTRILIAIAMFAISCNSHDEEKETQYFIDDLNKKKEWAMEAIKYENDLRVAFLDFKMTKSQTDDSVLTNLDRIYIAEPLGSSANAKWYKEEYRPELVERLKKE